jgi:hypothetical protein
VTLRLADRWIWDFWFAEEGEVVHVFRSAGLRSARRLRRPRDVDGQHHPRIGRLVLPLHWSSRDGGRVERIGLATSTDVPERTSLLPITPLYSGTPLYAGKLTRRVDRWFVIGFIDQVDARFVGELAEPIPFDAHSALPMAAALAGRGPVTPRRAPSST